MLDSGNKNLTLSMNGLGYLNLGKLSIYYSESQIPDHSTQKWSWNFEILELHTVNDKFRAPMFQYPVKLVRFSTSHIHFVSLQYSTCYQRLTILISCNLYLPHLSLPLLLYPSSFNKTSQWTWNQCMIKQQG